METNQRVSTLIVVQVAVRLTPSKLKCKSPCVRAFSFGIIVLYSKEELMENENIKHEKTGAKCGGCGRDLWTDDPMTGFCKECEDERNQE